MPSYRISSQAKQDLRELKEYFAERDPDLAKRLLDAIEDTLRLLAKQPRLGAAIPRIREGLRYFVARKPTHRYLIFYYETESGIEISDVIHQARNWWLLFETGER